MNKNEEGKKQIPLLKLKKKKHYPLIGWREWVSLPELKIPFIKAKIGTCARTSALHAFAIEALEEYGKQRIRFDIHPFQHNTEAIITCVADVKDKRLVNDSGGHQEERYVIETDMVIGDACYKIEITL